MNRVARLFAITDELVARLSDMVFPPPVAYRYNPLVYARNGYDAYLARFGKTAKSVLFVGMNPGPFGMVQTGVPFGDVHMVKSWMGLQVTVSPPFDTHPNRPVLGLACPRQEVSGRRLWGWAKERFGEPDAFFSRFFVLNYCPLAFVEKSGRNRTPDRLPAGTKRALFNSCDRALVQTVQAYAPQWVIGVGGFSEQRIRTALKGWSGVTGRITHPSPANPLANRGWAQRIESELTALGIDLADKTT